MQIKELRDGERGINIIAKVVQKGEPREVQSRYGNRTYRVADCKIEDETGTIKLSLWDDQIDQVQIGNTVKIENGYINSFRGELQLNSGKYGKLSVE